MSLIIRGFYLFLLCEIFIAFLANLVLRRFPPLPGDLFIDRNGLRLYIPFVSGLVLAVVLSFILQYFPTSIISKVLGTN